MGEALLAGERRRQIAPGRSAGRRAAAFSVVLALCLAGCGDEGANGAEADTGAFDAERAMEDVRAQAALGPRPAGSAANRRQVKMLVERLAEAGLKARVQRPHRNVVARIPGRERGSVVVGAHHDTVDIPNFVGANDGASGVAVVLELARSLPRKLDGPSLRVALFDAEEARPGRDFAVDGTRGSRQYVRYAKRDSDRQGSPPIDSIRAMVLFDLVGDCDLQIPREANSDRRLYSAFEAAALEADDTAAPFGGTTSPISDDHLPFIAAGIPAVDLIDFTFGDETSPGPYWHTDQDTVDKVCVESLDAVGEAAVRAVPRLP